MEIQGNNVYKHLILKCDEKLHKFEDITNQVIYLNDNGNSWYVVYANKYGPNKQYYKSYQKLLVSTNPIKVDFDRNNVYINKRKSFDVLNIQKFDDLGYKLYLKDNKTLYVKELSFENNRLEINYIDFNIKKSGNNVFDYYKTLAKYASDIVIDDLSIEKLLYNLYRKIERIDEKSVLDAYTNLKIKNVSFDKQKVIFPFSTNLSQMKALCNTFESNLSVISGPPGTGKTQVILNIIANAIVLNKKIAVISNNNNAVENVYDKLKEHDLDFLIAYLGNSENVDRFFEKEDNLLTSLEILKTKIKGDRYESVLPLINTLEKLFKYQNDIIIQKQDLYEIEEEFHHYQKNNEYVDFGYDFIKKYSIEKCLELKYYLISLKKIGFFQKLRLKYKYKIKELDYDQVQNLQTYIDYKYYELRIKQCKNMIDEMNIYIKINNMDVLLDQLKTQSIDIFLRYVLNKFMNYQRSCFTKANYKDNFEKFVDRYPVTLSTTQSLLRNCQYGFKYDLVVIDEASQSDILTSLLTMNVTKQMVVVGDDKQLSQIDNQEIYKTSDILIDNFKITECFQYKDNSILNSVLSLPTKVNNTILREHYRCDARIIEFCNKKFYNNELIICTKTSDEDPLIVVHTVSGNHARKNPNGSGQYNDREAQEIINIISSLDEKDIGVITPFRAQADYIKGIIKSDHPNVEVDSIHKYQGRQKKIVILSTVVNDLKIEEDDFITNFVTNSQLLNVAISRAITKLYIVVSDKVYNSKNNTISQFINYIKYYCREQSIEEGKVVSIFDKLYVDNYEALKKSPLYKKVDSYAELLMIDLLDKVLKEYSDYSYSMHVKLDSLIKTTNGFSNDEIRYIKHPWTHVDFVIYDKISFSPVLCIEVDGVKYHDYAKKQIKHDEIKSRVLKANGLILLRLKTNESNETEKIKYILG